MFDLVPLTTPMADGVMAWFAETTLVASVLALVALVCCRSRRLGPAARHALWLVVLVKMMTPPLIHWPWSRPLLPTISAASERPKAERIASAQSTKGPTISRGLGDIHTAVDPREDGSHATTVSPPMRIARLAMAHRGLPGEAGVAAVAAEPDWRAVRVWVVAAWLAGSVAIGVGQGRRIARFRRLLRGATPAPGWLVEEAEAIGRRMGVRVPAIRIVGRLGTPLLWCLGRPVLLVPKDVLGSLEAEGRRGVLAHELAHLRRGDPWVRRLELVAGLVWWWNPLYWLARRRLDFEAELACDAWVLWALPDDRLGYAESLVRICKSLSSSRSPMPALGVAGSGRSFERRLVMILRERVSHHASATGLLAAALLAVLSMPSWTLADPARAVNPASNGPIPALRPAFERPDSLVADDDDDDDDQAAKKAKAKAAKAKAKTKTKAKASDEGDEPKARSKEVPGPELEKKMEAFGKEMEKKFGPGSEFEKKMEAFGKEMEEKFGPEFEKKMEAFGKDMEKKFGPQFEKQMEAFGKDMEKKFGPEFEKQMEALGEQIGKEFGPGSKFAEKMKDVEKMKAKSKAPAKEKTGVSPKKTERTAVTTKSKATKAKKADRIEALESKIEQLMEELKQLKAQGDEDEDEVDADNEEAEEAEAAEDVEEDEA
jgi:bla regulator protein BlaR1